MLLTKARHLLSITSTDRTQKQRFFRGLQILAQFDDTLCPTFVHDQMFVASFSETVAKMSEDELLELARCGWFEAEESWSHFE